MSLRTKDQEKLGTDIDTTPSWQSQQPARRKSTAIEKTAFRSSLITTIMLIGIAILVKVGSGITSIPLVTTTITFLVCTIILAVRNNWTTLAATVLEGGALFAIWTQPFVIDSLNNPKGPDGGFYHFFGVVLIVCGALLAFGCNLGATVQNLITKNRRSSPWYTLFVGLVIGLAIGAVHMGKIWPDTPAPTGLTYTNGTPTLHMSTNKFLLSTVTISKGSKLLLVDDSAETHDLFNGTWQNSTPVVKQEVGAPLVNNVQLKSDSVAIGPFPVAGTYHIFCTVHPGMTLTIIVQ